MKLIIDIPEEAYNAVIGDEWIDSEYIDNIINSIQNSTPFEEELKKLWLQIYNIDKPDHDFDGFYQCQDEAIEIISKAIDELKGE